MEFQATIPLGKPNRNGRIYTKDSFLCTNYNVPVFLNYGDERNYAGIIGRANVNLEDDKMEMKITAAGKGFEEFINGFNDNVKPVFCCRNAEIDEKGIIQKADITEIFFTTEPAFTDITFKAIERIIESADICDYCKHFYNKDDACYKCMLQDGTEDMFEGIKVERLDI